MKYCIKFFDGKFVKFLLVGILNTLIGLGLMFGLYEVFNLGYWGATFLANAMASIFSFFMNKNITFKSDMPIFKSAIRFILVIAICYFLAYGMARPGIGYLLANWNVNMIGISIDKISMLMGMCIFTILNYIGQRTFAFKK